MFLTDVVEPSSDAKNTQMDFIDYLNKYWTFIGIVLSIIVIILFVFYFCKKQMMAKSNMRLNQNNNQQKYIKEVYIEVGNSAEKLRYFSDKRMIRHASNILNIMLSDTTGKIIAHSCHIYFFHKNRLFFKSNLNKVSNFLNDSNVYQLNIEQFARHNASYRFKEKFDELSSFVTLYSKQVMIVKGNAGSGKTNLIYDYCLYLKRKKQDFIYINCRDAASQNVEEYFNNSFYINGESFKLVKEIAKCLFLIKKIILRKRIFVIFEGANEAESDSFDRNLITFINDIKLHKIQNKVFKFIISTREEHYSNSFKDVIEGNLNDKSRIVYNDLSMIDDRNTDFENIIQKYSDYFSYTGTISPNTTAVISQSFFMIRLFFELYKNKKEDIDIRNSRQIFQTYIDELNKQYKCSSGILNTICEIMIKQKKFDGIPYEEVIKKGFRDNNIDELLNCSTLFCKSMDYSSNKVLGGASPVLTIVFDEFRDYLLASSIFNERTTIAILKDMLVNGYTCKEGVSKYLYLSYRVTGNILKCKEILGISQLKNIHVYYKNYNVNIVTSIILDSNSTLKQFEIDYISELPMYGYDAYLIFEYLLKKISEDDSLIIYILKKIKAEKCSFSVCFNHFKYRNFEQILNEEIEKGYNNTIVIDCLKYIIEQIKDREEERSQYMVDVDEELLDYKYEFAFTYIPLFENNIISRKKFLNKFGLERNSYFYKKLTELYYHFFGFYWNPKKEYEKFYSQSFKTYDDFLIAHYHMTMRDLKQFNRSDLRFKFYFSNSDNSVLNLLRDDAILEIIEEVIDTHYEN